MIAELGHFSLTLALVVSLLQAIIPFWGLKTHDARLLGFAKTAALVQCALVALAFLALVFVYTQSDFSVANVFANSHSRQPLIYKITGTWGNHEGSMLLWVLILALFAALVALFDKGLGLPLKATTLAMQGLMSFGFLLFVVFTSNPFLRLDPAPFEGKNLNPILQDLGLAIHPPLLYIGYVGFSIVFSFAAAALVLGRGDGLWARAVRPWILTAWIALTLGIAMGSYWAYYELGWGGYWFWDPVENASLMPWLTGTALLHSAVVMEKREALKIWTILLAILTFSLSLLGTFLVRSGVLTSVHVFASDPSRGLFILILLVLFIGGALALFALRAPSLSTGRLFAPLSREGALVFNNLFLGATCLSVLTGTLYPLLLEAITGDKISVGAPFFVLTFVPLALPLVFAMPVGQQLAWKKGAFLGALQRLWGAIALAFLVAALIAFIIKGGPLLVLLGIALGFYLIFGALDDLRLRASRGAGAFWARLSGLPLTVFATAIAHAGVGVMVLGLAATAFEEEKIVSLKLGESIQLAQYDLRYEGIERRNLPHFREEAGRFTLSQGGVALEVLEPSRRLYPGREMATSETARFTTGLFSQVYLALGESESNGSVGVRAYWKPFILLIWLGPVIMALGGLLALFSLRPLWRRRKAADVANEEAKQHA